MIILNTNGYRYYSDEQAEKASMTVGEFIELLKMYDENDKIALCNDNGYTYTAINVDDIEERYVRHLGKYKATGIVYDFDEGDEDEVAELPTEMTVECYGEDEVEEKISDITGWCVESIETIEKI